MRTRRAADEERGVVLVLTALLLVPLLVVSALAIDLGSWYAQTSRMQRAADASALAGVVWMPDFATAQSVARTAAARNGFAHDPTGTGVVVSVTAPGREQLAVSITADGDITVGRLALDEVRFDRAATAEYVLPVPLGSPRNFFGTGTLNTGLSENLWLSVNPWCTDKVDGDRYQSRYDGNRPYNNSSSCPSNPSTSSRANDEYRANGYEFYIDVPPNRTSALQVLLYDARYRVESGGPDVALYTGNHDFTYTVFAPDSTPLDDSDNPSAPDCPSVTYGRDTAFSAGSYLGGARWNLHCQIGTTRPAGRYILRVRNTDGQRFAAGANNFSVVARYATHTGNGLCDSRTSPACPRVYGKDAISVFADQSSSTADFFLSEIDPIHEGKIMRVSLYDPGEGGSDIRIRRPTGASSYENASFTWTASNGTSGGPTTSLNVTGNRFNGETVDLAINLAGYAPPANNRWWQIRYNFGSSAVTDRTTWSVSITGDPVHLIE